MSWVSDHEFRSPVLCSVQFLHLYFSILFFKHNLVVFVTVCHGLNIEKSPNYNTYIVYRIVEISIKAQIFIVFTPDHCYRLSVHVRGSGIEPTNQSTGQPTLLREKPIRFLVKIDRYGNEIKAIMISS